MIKLDLSIFGGRGGGSGIGADKNKGPKLGDEVTSSKGFKKDHEYLIVSNKGEKTIRTGAQLLSQIKNKTLKYDYDIYHWVTSKGSYIIRRIIRRKK